MQIASTLQPFSYFDFCHIYKNNIGRYLQEFSPSKHQSKALFELDKFSDFNWAPVKVTKGNLKL